jgi:hypothetical protein
LIYLRFSESAAKSILRRSKAGHALDRKISLANFSSHGSLIRRAESSSCLQGEPNGLESTEDRRSAVRHGNQHVCERHPQVICGKSFT